MPPYGQPQQQPPQQLNPAVQTLFQAPPPQTAPSAFLMRGSLITFNYAYWIHDPYPLVIVADYAPGNRLRGVNLHYLTFPYIKNILSRYSVNQSFSYQNIKSDQYIVSAFRSYKWNGISRIKKFDTNFLLTVMSAVRSFDPAELDAIRQSVEQQLQRQVNPTADQMTQQNPGELNG